MDLWVRGRIGNRTLLTSEKSTITPRYKNRCFYRLALQTQTHKVITNATINITEIVEVTILVVHSFCQILFLDLQSPIWQPVELLVQEKSSFFFCTPSFSSQSGLFLSSWKHHLPSQQCRKAKPIYNWFICMSCIQNCGSSSYRFPIMISRKEWKQFCG